MGRNGDRNVLGGDRAIAGGYGLGRRGDRWLPDRWYNMPGSIVSGPVTPLDPSTVAGLKLWLKADSLALADGAAVTTWTDSSGNGNNATAVGAPVFKTNILNGKPVIRFVGVQGFTLATAIAGTSAGPWTVVAVMKPLT
jgi:hypothetical protein